MATRVCVICGTEFKSKHHNPNATPYCKRACALEALRRRRKVVSLACRICGKIVQLSGRNGLARAGKGSVVCSARCQKTLSSETMAATNREYASARMKVRNPMKRAAIRAKVSTTLRLMGWKPPIHAGNGETTIPQRLLACALGWPMEVAVPTREPRGSNYPTSYKADIANAALKIAVEVDGGSHKSLARRAEDEKKDAHLRKLGWTVLRFSNEEAIMQTGACLDRVRSIISK